MSAVSRRMFLRASTLAGGGALFSFGWIADALAVQADPGAPASAGFRPNGFVRIDADGAITIWSKNPDMGQGVKTALPMILADEMDADWARIKVIDAELDRAKFGGQGSGGSDSIRSEWDLYRNAGAAAREMLASAAAEQWGVPRDACRTEQSAVIHSGSNRRLSYGQLAASAATRAVPDKPAWKQVSAFTLMGTRVGGVDNDAIVSGRPLYGIDTRLGGMRFAAISKCPVFGGRPARVDERAARQVPGVLDVVRIDGHANPTFLQPGVAVVAESTWAAFKGRDALELEWDEGPYRDESSASLSRQFTELAAGDGTSVRQVGDVARALDGAARVVEAYYEAPFLAHATLEPVNCTADVRDGHCYITGPLQMQTSGAGVVAAVTGLPVDRVHVQMTRLGGGFGRRLLSDYAAEAAVVSQRIKAPVQVVGTREDDLRHDYYRPAGARQFRIGLDAGGRIVAWDCHLVNLSRNAYRRGATPAWSTETYGMVAGVSDDLEPDLDLDLVPWHIPNVRLRFSEPRSGVSTGAWRAPAHVANGFAIETLLDEVAQLAGRSPVDLRLGLYGAARDLRIPGDEPSPYNPDRMAAVLRLAADRGGFGEHPPEGRVRGLAAHYTFGSYCAQVVELSLEGGNGAGPAARRTVRLHKVTCALDCGIVVNRSGVEAQAQGGIIDGLGHAFYGEITIDKGRAVEGNFDRYRLIRHREAPAAIEVHIVPSTMRPTGFGEIAVPVIAPAVANAIAAATGQRLRRTPFSREGFVLG
ncbi:MAG TPA: molybdopterin cofactor-binding domain-containing protein [Vicinamibacterales bacterium]|nr:molybdopterin cofactor-binding domain-containing protein [Vicinamibacterales bacterium]